MATLEHIKELRNRTGCGMVDCKEALAEAARLSDGQGDDIEKAIEVLRKKGVVKAAKKADRDTSEGAIGSYVHSNGKIAVLVSILCETDFVARNEKFQALARDVAMHIAASDPVVVSPDDVPEDLITKERAIAEEQAKEGDKPAEIQEKIIEGKLKSFREERALLTQPFVKEPGKSVQDLVNEAIQELGENISIKEFTRISI